MQFFKQYMQNKVLLFFLILPLVVFTIFELVYSQGFSYNPQVFSVSDYDEGVYIETGLLVNAGYHLYSQIYSLQPPFFSVALALVERLPISSVLSARLLLYLFGLILLLSLFGIALFLKGKVAGFLSLFFLVLSPGFLIYSHSIEEEIPMLSLCAASLWFIILWQKNQRQVYIFVSGLLLSLALLIKLFAVIVLPSVFFVFLLVFLKDRNIKQILKSLSVFLIGLFIPFFLSILMFGSLEIKQMFSDRLNSPKTLNSYSFGDNFFILTHFLLMDIGLAVLAVIGAAMAAIKITKEKVFLLIWLITTLLLILVYHPLMYHHPVLLLAPMVLLAAFSIHDSYKLKHKYSVLLVLSIIIYVCFLPKLFLTDKELFIKTTDSRIAVANYVKNYSKSSERIITGDLWIALYANRLVVPDLADPSFVRINSGLLTSPQAINDTRLSNVKLIIPESRLQSLSCYILWLNHNYHKHNTCNSICYTVYLH